MVKIPSFSTPNSAAKKAALLLQEKQKAKTAGTPEIAVPTKAKEGKDTVPSDQFEVSRSPVDLPTGVAGSGNAASLRIQSMLGSVSFDPAKDLGLKKSSDGKIAQGDLKVSSAKDLELLRGVEVLQGTLTLEELDLGSLDHLSSLKSVGSLSLEGLGELNSLSDFAKLQNIETNLYIGFNDGLDNIELPGLENVGGALIIEGQLHARTLSLPALESVGKYVHVTENLALRNVDLGALSGAEIVVADNYALKRAGFKSAESVEWSNNH